MPHVPLKQGTSFYGLYRIEVSHLPLSAAAQLVLALVFCAVFVPLYLNHGPEWIVILSAYFTASFTFGLLKDVTRIVIQSAKEGN